MGTSPIQSQIVLPDAAQIISKQPMHAVDPQGEHIRELKQHAQSGIIAGTTEVREQVLRDQFATLEGIALAVVLRPDLPMQLAEMSERVKNLVTGHVPIHSEGLLL